MHLSLMIPSCQQDMSTQQGQSPARMVGDWSFTLLVSATLWSTSSAQPPCVVVGFGLAAGIMLLVVLYLLFMKPSAPPPSSRQAQQKPGSVRFAYA
jgi:hypothetical protein